jgi:hypothetical protein
VVAKFHKSIDNEKETRYVFHCPGCGYAHGVKSRGPEPVWIVTGLEEDKPSVTPSILATGEKRCHSYVREGKIQFLDDCDHTLAGQTVDLPDFHY